jgi:hypothetical protein
MSHSKRRVAAPEISDSSQPEEEEEEEEEEMAASKSAVDHSKGCSSSDDAVDGGPDADADAEPEPDPEPIPPQCIPIPIPVLRGIPETAEASPDWYKFIETHSELEIAERRIIQGRCAGFSHAGEVADVPPDRMRQMHRDDSDEERKKRYRKLARPQPIPAFWPARPWDAPDQQMSAGASQRLAAQIEASMHRGMKKRRRKGGSSEKRKPNPKSKPKRKRNLTFKLSNLDFTTDKFDEFTDIEL